MLIDCSKINANLALCASTTVSNFNKIPHVTILELLSIFFIKKLLQNFKQKKYITHTISIKSLSKDLVFKMKTIQNKT